MGNAMLKKVVLSMYGKEYGTIEQVAKGIETKYADRQKYARMEYLNENITNFYNYQGNDGSIAYIRNDKYNHPMCTFDRYDDKLCVKSYPEVYHGDLMEEREFEDNSERNTPINLLYFTDSNGFEVYLKDDGDGYINDGDTVIYEGKKRNLGELKKLYQEGKDETPTICEQITNWICGLYQKLTEN